MKKTAAQIVRDELKKAKMPQLHKKVDVLTRRWDQIEDAARIIRENEETLKYIPIIKRRLDVLDKIFVSVDKIAGEVITYREQQELNSKALSDHDDRLETIEKHLNLPAAS